MSMNEWETYKQYESSIHFTERMFSRAREVYEEDYDIKKQYPTEDNHWQYFDRQKLLNMYTLFYVHYN